MQAEKLWFKHYSISAKIQIVLDINPVINLTKDFNPMFFLMISSN
jgi:hypothetical protein